MAASSSQRDKLKYNEELNEDEQLVSPDGKCTLTLQSNGRLNLQLEKEDGKRVSQWTSTIKPFFKGDKSVSGPFKFTLQSRQFANSNNPIIFNGSDHSIWNAETHNYPLDCHLQVTNDGDFQLIDSEEKMIWSALRGNLMKSVFVTEPTLAKPTWQDYNDGYRDPDRKWVPVESSTI